MEARVIGSYRWNMVRACAGAEFIKGEWRRVPAGLEEEAMQADMLETRADEHPADEKPTTVARVKKQPAVVEDAPPAEASADEDEPVAVKHALKPKAGKG